jgi:hypothetical protein
LVAIDLFSLSIVHGVGNGLLLRLIECIESIKSDVKRKMTLRETKTHAPRSPKRAEEEICSAKSARTISAHEEILHQQFGGAGPASAFVQIVPLPRNAAALQLKSTFFALAHL